MQALPRPESTHHRILLEKCHTCRTLSRGFYHHQVISGCRILPIELLKNLRVSHLRQANRPVGLLATPRYCQVPVSATGCRRPGLDQFRINAGRGNLSHNILFLIYILSMPAARPSPFGELCLPSGPAVATRAAGGFEGIG